MRTRKVKDQNWLKLI